MNASYFPVEVLLGQNEDTHKVPAAVANEPSVDERISEALMNELGEGSVESVPGL